MKPGGDTRVWEKIIKKLKSIRFEPHARVGVFGDATKAATHELGSRDGTIKERSFIRLTFAKKEREQAAFTAKLAKALVTRDMTVRHAIEQLGEWGVKEVRATIVSQPPEWPALNEKYEDWKHERGKTKILVLEGELITSITYEVKLRDVD